MTACEGDAEHLLYYMHVACAHEGTGGLHEGCTPLLGTRLRVHAHERVCAGRAQQNPAVIREAQIQAVSVAHKHRSGPCHLGRVDARQEVPQRLDVARVNT